MTFIFTRPYGRGVKPTSHLRLSSPQSLSGSPPPHPHPLRRRPATNNGRIPLPSLPATQPQYWIRATTSGPGHMATPVLLPPAVPGPCHHERSRACGHANAGASFSRGAGTSSSPARLPCFPNLPPPPPPQSQYISVQQRNWGTWVSDIIDKHTHKKIWIDSFHSAEQATREYDIMSVRLHGIDGHINFPRGGVAVGARRPVGGPYMGEEERPGGPGAPC